MTRPEKPLAPAHRSRPASTAAAGPTAFEEAEIARGQTDALLGALGRMQIKLDVIARDQTAALARIEQRLEALERRLGSADPLQ